MKNRSLLLAVLCFFFLNSCDYEYVITESEIQETLTNLFPIEKESFVVTFSLSDPKVIFDTSSNRIELYCKCITRPAGGMLGEFEYPLHFSTSLLYEDNSNSLYFHNIQIEENTARSIPSEIRGVIIPAITKLTNDIVEEYPIYSLNDESLTHRFAQRYCRDIEVRSSSIVITFSNEE